jgi:hypothetical protein
VSYAGLQLFLARDGGVVRVGNDVYHGDAIETDHLFKIGVSSTVTVDVLQSDIVVRAVRVGLKDATPLLALSIAHGDVQEYGVGRTLQDAARLAWVSGDGQASVLACATYV